MSLRLIGKKKGMTQIFDEKGNLIVCSVLEAEPNVIVQIKDKDKDGYQAVQLGGIKVPRSRKKNIKKPLVGHFAKSKVDPRLRLIESKVESLDGYEVGKEIGVDYFSDIEFVDVIGTSKGKGFQGVMKRHNFRGGPRAHGSKFHRSAGSTGMRSTPGRCTPGKRMAGRMGGKRSVLMNLRVVKVDVEKQIILVEGGVPGAKGGVLFIRKSVKKRNLLERKRHRG